MIFIANVLTMHGGSTFLLRVCREYHRRGLPVAVLVIFPKVDKVLYEELAKYAKIIELRFYAWDFGLLLRSQFSTFVPVFWSKLLSDLKAFGSSVHVMGVFGLFFAFRMRRNNPSFRVSAGVYHQNEYMFEAGSSFFVRCFRRCFDSLLPEEMLFFNQINPKDYGVFFKRDFSSSLVTPIGIDLPKPSSDIFWNPEKNKLISVGNLVPFKTYNKHAIQIIADLSATYPDVTYDIYGVGSEESFLKDLAKKLNVQDKVRFHGAMPYSDFAEVVSRASVFVGSGTALVEAAALGVPALIGIESIPEPETYGFLSDVPGFSYNELIPEYHRKPMASLIEQVLSDAIRAKEVSDACRNKALEFSVELTVDAIAHLERQAKQSHGCLSVFETIRLFFSFMGIAVRDAFGVSTNFRRRREQSLVVEGHP
jgi:glycosyltransferase involved in cell wall biosynthesis